MCPYAGPFLKTSVPTDVDECSSGASCGPHGHCTNTEGSFRCSCAPGYRAPPGRPGPCTGEQSGARARSLGWGGPGFPGEACWRGEAGLRGCGWSLETGHLGCDLGAGLPLCGRGLDGRGSVTPQPYLACPRRERVPRGRFLLPPRRVPQHRRLLCLYLCPRLPAWTPRSLLPWSVLRLEMDP